jgi:hypothetical protein
MTDNSQPVLPEKVIEAFHLMWGNFPEPVTLVHKSFCVMALNKASEANGVLKTGMKCNKIGKSENHAGCLAQKAIAAKKPMYSYKRCDDRDQIGYWIPLDDYPDFYVHFGIGYTTDYKTAAALLQDMTFLNVGTEQC